MEWLRDTIRDLAAERARIVLVILGVVWGTLSLTIVLAFGEGFDRAMQGALRNSGPDLLRFWRGATTRPWEGLGAGRPIYLRADDGQAIERAIPGVRGVSIEYASMGDPLEYAGKTVNVRVHGVQPIYGHLRRLVAQPGGRFLNHPDETDGRRVVFLGDEVKRRVFGRHEAVGRTVRIWGLPFTVVGVLAPRRALSNYEGMDESKVMIPASTFRAIRGWRRISYVIVGLRTVADEQSVRWGTYRVLAKRHRFDPADEAALGCISHVETGRRVGSIVGGTRILMGIVGFFGLLVALAGVANVMYVLVEERRREIAIRMAVGTRPGSIARSHVTEGLVLTVAGGFLGVLASLAVLWLLDFVPLDDEARTYLGWPEFSIPTALAVSSILGVAGCFAGYWPARRAASLDPVEALVDD